MLNIFWNHLIEITLDMAPWLLFGLIVAGLVKAWIPESFVLRWLGGNGIGPIIRGALIGVPLPLCSCSVIPMAIGLRRNGASKSSTVSFLVATPETGVDSIALSWVMLGPFMTVARPVGAVISAVYSGFLTMIAEKFDAIAESKGKLVELAESKMESTVTNCCSSKKPNLMETINQPLVESKTLTDENSGLTTSCCSTSKPNKAISNPTLFRKTQKGITYSLTNLWDDIALWLLGGIMLTALVKTIIPEGDIQAFSDHNFITMLVMVALSVPVYVCATASTPMAAAMLFSDMTPGVVLAFLIAGPGTNLAPLALIKKEMGWRTMVAYVTGIVTSAIILGLLTDWIIYDINLIAPVNIQITEFDRIPVWFSASSTLLLILLAFRNQLGKIIIFFNLPQRN